MPYRCDRCFHIFSDRTGTCPLCGGRLTPDSPADSELKSTPNEGYFSQFAVSSGSTAPEVEIPSITPSDQSASGFYDEAYEKEMRRLENQQRRLNREYNRLALSNFLINIPWRAVLHMICVFAALIFLLTLWHMRFAILEFLISFLIALLPVGFIAVVFWYMIKLFFH